MIHNGNSCDALYVICLATKIIFMCAWAIKMAKALEPAKMRIQKMRRIPKEKTYEHNLAKDAYLR